MRKVPEVTPNFWITKILTTAMGEAVSDSLVHILHPVPAVLLGAVVLVGALILQFRVPRYVPWVYWLAVAMVAVSGTMAADVLHLTFGIPYVATTIFFAIVLAIVFVVWQRTENTLSIHSINTPRREMFYWATVMSTFALGTAAGDMTAHTMNLGFFISGAVFGGLILIPALVRVLFQANEILTFWVAYVLTRPLGASFADGFGKSKLLGGLGFGDGLVGLALALVIAGFVAYMTVQGRDPVEPSTSAHLA